VIFACTVGTRQKLACVSCFVWFEASLLLLRNNNRNNKCLEQSTQKVFGSRKVMK
jgi:hypothetical protein